MSLRRNKDTSNSGFQQFQVRTTVRTAKSLEKSLANTAAKLSRVSDLSKKLREENRHLRRENKYLLSSRDGWKSKYMAFKKAQSGQQSQLRVKGHRFDAPIILLAVMFQMYGGIGLRGCHHCLVCLWLVLSLPKRPPCHVTIRSWACRLGFHRVTNGFHSKFPSDTKWAIWVDESIVLGAESLLLVLGMPLSSYPFEEPVQSKDIYILRIESGHGWTSTQVADVLSGLANNYRIAYACSDMGSNLVGAYERLGITHIPDCSHAFANILEKLYKDDPSFKSFTVFIGNIRAKWSMSKHKVIFVPPAHRTKARFANIFPCVEWAQRTLALLADEKKGATISDEVREGLKELCDYKHLIDDLIVMHKTQTELFKILKHKGFALSEKADLLSKLPVEGTEKQRLFTQKVKIYLGLLEAKIGTQQRIICCSDIIESQFGKAKMKINAKSPYGITEFIYAIANFTGGITQEEVKTALETISNKKLAEEWRKKEKQSIVELRNKMYDKPPRKRAKKNKTEQKI